MYELVHGVLQERTGGAVFAPYNLWHILYLLLLVGGIAIVILCFRNSQYRERISAYTVTAAFLLYMADFFLMPFSYGYIDIDKLPFHVCTLSSILCFASRHNRFLGKFKVSFSLMGLIGALIYLVYPAGVADGEVSFFSYRILQTLLFHGLMAAQGIFVLAFGEIKLEWRGTWRDLVAIAATVVWAMLGNRLYSGVENGRTFNWCFVSNDPLGLIPDTADPYVMPFVVVAVLFATNLLIYLLCRGIRTLCAKRAQ